MVAVIRGIDMSNVKVRPVGYYLVRDCEGGELGVVSLSKYTYGAAVFSAGTEVEWAVADFHWIADEPLDLESIILLMMNGGLENAVKVVHEDSSKTSSVLFLEKELKRYKDWYGDMDSLSR